MNLYQGLLFLHGFRIDPAHVDDTPRAVGGARRPDASTANQARPMPATAPARLRAPAYSAIVARSAGNCG